MSRGQSSVKFTLHQTYLSGFSLLIEFTMVISAAIYGLNGVGMAFSDRQYLVENLDFRSGNEVFPTFPKVSQRFKSEITIVFYLLGN